MEAKIVNNVSTEFINFKEYIENTFNKFKGDLSKIDDYFNSNNFKDYDYNNHSMIEDNELYLTFTNEHFMFDCTINFKEVIFNPNDILYRETFNNGYNTYSIDIVNKTIFKID